MAHGTERSSLPRWPSLLAALVVVLGLGFVAGRTFYGPRELSLRVLGGQTMGTTWTARLAVPEGAPEAWIDAVADTIQSRVDRVERLMSTWDTTSELSRFNRSRDTSAVPVSPETFEVLSIAGEVGRATGGALDVTVAPLLAAWSFGPAGDGEPSEIPAQGVLDALEPLVGLDRIVLDEDGGTIRKLRPGVTVDLSAVAKGYAVDRAADGTASLGVPAFAIEVGGEVRTRGRRPDGSAWKVAVEAPVADARRVFRVLNLTDEAVATSGDYRDFYEIGGVRFAHILDPRTRRPVTWTGFSVSVIHQRAADADAWATALSVLGPEDGLALAEERKLTALFVIRSDGGWDVRQTRRMTEREATPESP